MENCQYETSSWIKCLLRHLRSVVKPLEGDRPLSDDIRNVAKALSKGSWLPQIESELGEITRL